MQDKKKSIFAWCQGMRSYGKRLATELFTVFRRGPRFCSATALHADDMQQTA